ILLQTVQPLGPGGHSPRTGAGLVQVIDPSVTPVVGPVVNASHVAMNQSEVAVAIDPKNSNNMAILSNENDVNFGMGLFTSTDGGKTFASRVIADGNDNLNLGFSDPALAWDTFGNLYAAWVDGNNNDIDDIVIST